MHKHVRMMLLCALSVLMLALAVGTANALRSIQLGSPGAITTTGSRVSFEDESRFLRMVCNLTFTGSINERSPKTAGAVAGSITSVRSRECTAFGVAVEILYLAETRNPFTKTFNSFLGTLPNITGLLYLDRNVGFALRALGRTCLYFGDVALLITVSGGQMQSLGFLARTLPLRREGSSAECPAGGVFRGSMTFERSHPVTLV